MTRCTLVIGGTGPQRFAAITARIQPDEPTAVILEGLSGIPAPTDCHHALLSITTIAVSCPCCDNGLIMRVTLTRMVQRRPARLFISLADRTHLAHMQRFLGAPPFCSRLTLTEPLDCTPAKTGD